MNFDIEYANSAQEKVAGTIYTLRQMRFAGGLTQQRQDIPISISEVLNDALELSQSAAPYLIQLITENHKTKTYTLWEQKLAEMKIKYHTFPEAGRHSFRQALLRFKSGLTVIATGDFGFMTNFFIKDDGIADREFKDLFDNNLGILAPLSTDILTACLFPEVIRLHSEKIPLIQPVLLSENLKNITLPKDSSGNPVFSNLNRILVYVDVNNTGDTLKAIAAAAQLEYSGKVIPRGERRFPL